MGIHLVCDWCGQPIPDDAPHVTIDISGNVDKYHLETPVGLERGSVFETRVYCGERRWEDPDPAARGEMQVSYRQSCYEHLRTALAGLPGGRVDAGMEWRLVPTSSLNTDDLLDGPLELLRLADGTRAALERGGVETIRELAHMTEAQWRAIKGIGVRRTQEIVAALRSHLDVDPQKVVDAQQARAAQRAPAPAAAGTA